MVRVCFAARIGITGFVLSIVLIDSHLALAQAVATPNAAQELHSKNMTPGVGVMTAFTNCEAQHRPLEPWLFDKKNQPKSDYLSSTASRDLASVLHCYENIYKRYPDFVGARFKVARLYAKLGKCRQAVTVYGTFMAADQSDENRRMALQAFRDLLPVCPRINLSFAELSQLHSEIDIFVNGHPIEQEGIEKDQNNTYLMDEGKNTVTVRVPGKQPWTTEQEIPHIEGCESPKSLAEQLFCPAEYPLTVPELSDKEIEMTPENTARKWVGIATASAGAASFLGSIVVFALSRSKWDDAVAACDPLFQSQDTICRSSAGASEAMPLGDEAKALEATSLILGIVGVSAGVLGGYLWYSSRPQPIEQSIRLTPTLSASPDGKHMEGGMILRGHF